MNISFKSVVALAALAALAACGGHKNSGSASTTAAGETTAGTAAPVLHAEAVPPGMHCGAEPPVWVNTRTHVYHLATDKYYGHTRQGEYLCRENAEREGDHLAGTMAGPHAAARGKRHHHRPR